MKITTEEAKRLIDMLKEHTLKTKLKFPNQKGKLEFNVFGEKLNEDEFVVNIERKGINSNGATFQGRIKSNNLILLRLDINPTGKHINPSDNKVLVGNHLHVYTEEYGDKEAIPFDTENENLYDLCLEFFKKFNIIKNPLEDNIDWGVLWNWI